MKTGCLLVTVIGILLCLPLYASCSAFTAPSVPNDAKQWMPEEDSEFTDGIRQIIQKSLPEVQKILPSALKSGLAVYCCVLLSGISRSYADGYYLSDITCSACISVILLQTSHSMISLAAATISEMTEYAKLFLPVMTAAYAAQGTVTSSSALYFGTSLFSSFLTNMIRQIFLPAVYLFLALSIAFCASEEQLLKGIRDQAKKLSLWFLKSTLAVYITYISLTGAVSGAVDKAAVRAAKAAIRTAVPVIGGSLADASEALLISTSIAKNAVGIYGIFAFLAMFCVPFFRIGIHCLVLKGTAAVCILPGTKRLSDLVSDFCDALEFLLGITGSISAILIIGTVCFMRGLGL